MKSIRNNCGAVVLALTIAGFGARAHGAYVLVDNFDGYTAGTNISGQGAWTANTVGSAISSVVANPGGSGQALSLPAFQTTAGLPSNYVYNNSSNINIANGTTGTLFYQFRFEGSGILNTSHGIADRAPVGGTDFSTFEVQVRSGNQDQATQYNDMYVRDGAAFEGMTSGVGGTSPKFLSGVWYNFWLVADNTADTFTIRVQSSQDPNYLTQTQLTSGADALNFRNGTTSALNAFYAMNGPSQAQALFFDNIYVDNSGINLVNPVPVPEPSALFHFAVGLGGWILLRRKRR